MDAVLDRALLPDELLHRALVLGELILVAPARREPVAGRADPGELANSCSMPWPRPLGPLARAMRCSNGYVE